MSAKDINKALRSMGFIVLKRKQADSWVVKLNDNYVGEHRITVSYTGHTFQGTCNHRAILGVYGPDYLNAMQGPKAPPASLTGDFKEIVVKAHSVKDCRIEARAKWSDVADWYLNRLESIL